MGTDAVEANSTTTSIVATAHAAQRGDVIRFTSGALQNKEVVVFSTSTNAIGLGETLASAPAAAVTFQILRHKKPRVNDAGELMLAAGISAGPVQFVRDSVDTETLEDTAVAANNRPLPVKLLNASGEVGVSGNKLIVDDPDTQTKLDTLITSNAAIQVAAEILDNAISGSEMQVDIVAALPAGTNNIGDVDVLSLPALPAGNNNIGDVDVASLPALPAGNNNIGDVDVASLPALAAGNNNIGDVDIASVPIGTYTDRSSSTSGTPSTSTQVAASNASRKYFFIQNLSLTATIYINFTSSAAASAGSIALPPLASFESGPTFISTEAVNVLSATASVPFTAKEA